MKKIISIILVLSTFLSLVPLSVFAEDESTSVYTDVKENHWFYDSVMYAYENGFMAGTSATKFSPGLETSRAMLVTILHRLEGCPETEGTHPFTDVKEDSYYEDAVLWASVNGVVYGTSETTYSPNATLTREQTAAILYRYATLKNYDITIIGDVSTFDDANKVGAWALDAVNWAIGVELISGMGNNTLAPRGSATRAQLATLLRFFCENIVENAGIYHNITYILNDGTEGAYFVASVNNNKRTLPPEAPERAFYEFAGWYIDPETTIAFDFSQHIVRDMVLYAAWVAPDGMDGAYSGVDSMGTTYSVSDLVVEGNNIVATVNANSTAVLVIEVVSEEGETLTTLSAQTPMYCEYAQISVPVDITLPEYFILRAVLYDFNSEPLCDVFESIIYTSAYEAFSSKTVNDYDSELVVNFDDDETDNFGVITDEVKKIELDGVHNLLTVIESVDYDSEAGENDGFSFITDECYIFDNIDSEIESLQPGDKVYIIDTDGSQYMFIVEEIENEGEGYCIIFPSQSVALTDFYEMIKIDMSLDVEDGEIADGGIATFADVEVKDAWNSSIGTNIELDLGSVTLEGDFTAKGDIQFEFIYDIKVFARDYCYCKFINDYELKLDLELTTSVDNEESRKKIEELATINIPTTIPGIKLYTTPVIHFEAEVKGGGSFEAVNKTKSGFIYETNSGTQKIDKKSTAVNLYFEGEAKVVVGPKIAIGVKFLGDTVKAEAAIFAGVELSLSTNPGLNMTDHESKHACILCLEGKCKLVANITAKVSVNIIDVVKFTPVNITIVEARVPVKFCEEFPGELYLSIINESDSMFGGLPKFGGGKCPNTKWKTTVTAEDADGNELNGHAYTIKVINTGEVIEGSTGEYHYLYNGAYVASTVIDGETVSKTFTVDEAEEEVLLAPDNRDGALEGRVCDYDTSSPISGATVLISQNGTVLVSCSTNSNGYYTADLPVGTYKVSITCFDYIPFETNISVSDNTTEYLETALMVEGQRDNMGGLCGYIRNAVNDEPIANAKLTVRNGWNNPDSGDIVAVMYTDSYGWYEYDTYDLFGIIIGLYSGNYTVVASKEGYSDTVFNVVIMPGDPRNQHNASMSPITPEGIYRVVLRWGETPGDLDSHLNAVTTGGSREHIYYSDKYGTSGNLDWDDTTSYGPETITVTDFEYLQNGFTYSVHDYTNRSSSSSTELSYSGAYVDVYKGDVLIRRYYVPTGRVGTVWNVFSVDANGNITDINSFENESSASDVGYYFAERSVRSYVGARNSEDELKDYEK